MMVLFFKQKTAYEMRISDWSSDVCSSDLGGALRRPPRPVEEGRRRRWDASRRGGGDPPLPPAVAVPGPLLPRGAHLRGRHDPGRSEEHTSELQSLMRNSYAVFCLKEKNTRN